MSGRNRRIELFYTESNKSSFVYLKCFTCVNDIILLLKQSRIFFIILLMPDLGGLSSTYVSWVAKLLLLSFNAIHTSFIQNYSV